MPIAYYGSRISPHMTETPEGFLICHDVPINRIGAQDYMGDEIGMTGQDAEKAFKVLRPPEEVFDKAALASFEGKPVTDNHPPENVTPDNIHAFARGHAQNIRKGAGGSGGCTIADLYITDPQLIEAVKDGKREISCGYTYDLVPNENGTFEQRRIRGNHIAVVDEGRAGHRVAIKDSKPTERGKNMATENKGSVLGRMLKAFAKDENTTPDELEEAAKKLPVEKTTDEVPKEAEKLVEDPLKKDEAKDEAPESEMLGKILEMLTELKTMLAPKESEDELEDLIHPEHEAAETPKEEAEERETGHEDEDEDTSTEEQEPSVTVSPEDLPEKEDGKGAMDSARQAAKITKEILRKNISDPKAFKMAAKDAAAEIRKAYGIPAGSNKGYATFMAASANAAKTRAATDAVALQNQREKIYADEQNAYNKFNPHMNKEDK